MSFRHRNILLPVIKRAESMGVRRNASKCLDDGSDVSGAEAGSGSRRYEGWDCEAATVLGLTWSFSVFGIWDVEGKPAGPGNSSDA